MDKKELKFAFFGTPEVASKTLDFLFGSGYTPKVIITSPDRRAGRGMHLLSTPVSLWADEHKILCLKPEKIDNDFIEKLKDLGIELSIVVAYGKILPEELIKSPELGTINIHYSLLPKYRGASPLEQALLNGDLITGITIQQMEFKLDSGAIIAQEEININIDDTKEELREKLINLGAEKLVEVIPDIQNGITKPKYQDENLASHCSKIKKEDGEIDPSGNAITNYNKYRAFFGWPGVFFFKNNKRVKIIKARYENNSFIIERVVPEGKKETSYKEFLNSNTSM